MISSLFGSTVRRRGSVVQGDYEMAKRLGKKRLVSPQFSFSAFVSLYFGVPLTGILGRSHSFFPGFCCPMLWVSFYQHSQSFSTPLGPSCTPLLTSSRYEKVARIWLNIPSLRIIRSYSFLLSPRPAGGMQEASPEVSPPAPHRRLFAPALAAEHRDRLLEQLQQNNSALQQRRTAATPARREREAEIGDGEKNNQKEALQRKKAPRRTVLSHAFGRAAETVLPEQDVAQPQLVHGGEEQMEKDAIREEAMKISNRHPGDQAAYADTVNAMSSANTTTTTSRIVFGFALLCLAGMVYAILHPLGSDIACITVHRVFCPRASRRLPIMQIAGMPASATLHSCTQSQYEEWVLAPAYQLGEQADSVTLRSTEETVLVKDMVRSTLTAANMGWMVLGQGSWGEACVAEVEEAATCWADAGRAEGTYMQHLSDAALLLRIAWDGLTNGDGGSDSAQQYGLLRCIEASDVARRCVDARRRGQEGRVQQAIRATAVEAEATADWLQLLARYTDADAGEQRSSLAGLAEAARRVTTAVAVAVAAVAVAEEDEKANDAPRQRQDSTLLDAENGPRPRLQGRARQLVLARARGQPEMLAAAVAAVWQETLADLQRICTSETSEFIQSIPHPIGSNALSSNTFFVPTLLSSHHESVLHTFAVRDLNCADIRSRMLTNPGSNLAT
ncbi:uncharacterized protein MYCFIDRAFT_180316 [Pseudocercospora fijiensis CIRAD86]|uniref:Uncharacterized protein n=1 Tax=Pseudocercospora fijiensis (strain CIRAD86) TaxID=383855 RepID=M2YGY7_PSEFD|nr:uncharacterized protein MYCFIDRAFT_180316 [Pseudocercospora fijiensis CIRAD86]EME77085.1 hypothetical protein MYCFIDRAFT_180316 [Pseudocercospora fijiensis CIRAD86]